jgi:hypothetical protein
MTIDPARNPYADLDGPYTLLGLKPGAAQRDIVRAREKQLCDIDDSCRDSEDERVARRTLLDARTDCIVEPRKRCAAELFRGDTSGGQAVCRAAAEKFRTFTFDYALILDAAGDMIPSELPIDDPERHFRDVVLNHCVRIVTETRKSDPAFEALESIGFDR